MPDSRAALNGEQRASADFGAAMAHLRPGLAGLTEGGVALDAITEAALRFGACELRMRRAERLRALGLREPEAVELVDSALAQHERGLQALAAVRPLADELAGQTTVPEGLELWRVSSGQIRAEWRRHVSELDVAPDHARHLMRIADQWCDSLDADGVGGLGRYIARQLDELEQARRSEDRGTRAASFPWWKIVMAAAILGMTAYAVWILVTTRAPWWAFWLTAQIACIMMLLIALGC